MAEGERAKKISRKKLSPLALALRHFASMAIFSHNTGSFGARSGRSQNRAAELGRLLPLWPREIADRSIEGRRRIVATIERALRAERKRGRAGHWAYDLARHVALHRAWLRECEEFANLQRNLKNKNGPPYGEPSRRAK